MPRPPALLTAATSSGDVSPLIPARTTGWSIPIRSVNLVLITPQLSAQTSCSGQGAGRQHLQVDRAAVRAIGAPGQPERPAARCWHVRDARPTRNRHHRLRLAEGMTRHIGGRGAVLGQPEDLVAAAIHPRAAPGYELGCENVG